MTRTTDSPRWCSECQLWGDHHTDRHPADPYTAGLERRLQAVVQTSRHNLEECQKVRDRLDGLLGSVADISAYLRNGGETWRAIELLEIAHAKGREA